MTAGLLFRVSYPTAVQPPLSNTHDSHIYLHPFPPPPPPTLCPPRGPSMAFIAVPSTAGAATEDIWPQGPREGGGRPKRLRRRRKKREKRSLPGGVCKSWRRSQRRKACITCRSMPGTSLRRTPLRDSTCN
ncbi:hypothetical protein Naga_100209g1 [Nannochloropsis gaditana]|uniref:Uncharacterized protein n=1 Tax=Nannochloropsis gaditana TaxID=72520 RepID=W7TGT6_9STRA|nr:hypothetical protein Naga_100209g1 [Nannochloropsis gaditana]